MLDSHDGHGPHYACWSHLDLQIQFLKFGTRNAKTSNYENDGDDEEHLKIHTRCACRKSSVHRYCHLTVTDSGISETVSTRNAMNAELTIKLT